MLVSYKMLFALLGFSAIVTEISTIAERSNFNPVNFFSFFTVENNILAFLVLMVSALYTASGKSPQWLSRIRGASTMYITVVGLGFAVLLSGIEGSVLTAVPWDNLVLHYVMPVALIVDLVLDRPSVKLKFKHSLIWLIYPAAYLAYSLIRGAIVGWYPYPFLNPSEKGYTSVALVCCALLVLSVALTWLICLLPQRKPSRALASK